MDKINVFWIEDNMLFGTTKGSPDRVEKWKEKLPSNDLFELTLFQSPIDVKEYLELKSSISTLDDLSVKCPQNIPDIVVFDYKMSDSFKANNFNAFKYEASEVTSKNASKRFVDLYKEISNFIPYKGSQVDTEKIESFAKDISKTAGEISNLDDEFGLFCGISIIREFKDYITCGVPASVNKPTIGDLNINSAFYEWINKYDLKGALEKDQRDSKDLKKDVLPFAVKLLRKRILFQTKSKGITINLEKILNILDFYKVSGNLSKVDTSNLGFDSNYGYRELSFKALFYDCTTESNYQSEKKNKKIEEIKNVINSIKNKKKVSNDDKIVLEEIEKKSEVIKLSSELQFEVWCFLNDILTCLDINSSSLNKINEVCSILWNTYLNVFESRIELSDLYNRQKNEEELSVDESDVLKNHLQKFNVGKDNKIGKSEIMSIENYFEKDNIFEIKVIVGILVARFHIEMSKRMAEFGMRKIYSHPDDVDIYILINPINNSSNDQNLLHPIHLMNKYIPGQTKKFGPTIIGEYGFKLSRKIKCESSATFYQMKWLKEGEKAIVKSFFSNDKLFFPTWLN